MKSVCTGQGYIALYSNKAQNSGMLGGMLCKLLKLNQSSGHIPNTRPDEMVTGYNQKMKREAIMKLAFQF